MNLKTAVEVEKTSQVLDSVGILEFPTITHLELLRSLHKSAENRMDIGFLPLSDQANCRF
jgi:hypothetical protein